MVDHSTGLRDSLRLLYRSHGGSAAIVKSGYFLWSVVAATLSWRAIFSESWMAVAQSVLPTLTGFSIAAFAIIFAVLNDGERRALSVPDDRLGGRSPFLILAGSVAHAVVVQIFGLIYAFIFSNKPFPSYISCINGEIVNVVASAIGLIIFIYGIMMVLAATLSIFRILEIKSRI
jgi:hypothetical protein